MAEALITRQHRDTDITLSTTTSVATTISLGDMAGGCVSFATMHTSSATLQMWGSATSAGTFRRVYKADGSVADITLAPSSTVGIIYALPDDVYGLPFLKIVAANTVTTSATGVVILKSKSRANTHCGLSPCTHCPTGDRGAAQRPCPWLLFASVVRYTAGCAGQGRLAVPSMWTGVQWSQRGSCASQDGKGGWRGRYSGQP